MVRIFLYKLISNATYTQPLNTQDYRENQNDGLTIPKVVHSGKVDQRYIKENNRREPPSQQPS